jgi:DNA gyrase subunit A
LATCPRASRCLARALAPPAAIGLTLRGTDRLVEVVLTDGASDLLLATRRGRVIRFPEDEVSAMGRTAQGVKGVRLGTNDALVGMLALRREAALCLVTDRGLAKRVQLAEFPLQKRGGLGTVALPVGARSGGVLVAKELQEGEDLMLVTSAGRTLRLTGEQVPLLDRTAPAEAVLELEADERIVDVTRVATRRPAPGARAEADTNDEEDDTEDGDAVETGEDGEIGAGAAGERDGGAPRDPDLDQLELLGAGE